MRLLFPPPHSTHFAGPMEDHAGPHAHVLQQAAAPPTAAPGGPPSPLTPSLCALLQKPRGKLTAAQLNALRALATTPLPLDGATLHVDVTVVLAAPPAPPSAGARHAPGATFELHLCAGVGDAPSLPAPLLVARAAPPTAAAPLDVRMGLTAADVAAARPQPGALVGHLLGLPDGRQYVLYDGGARPRPAVGVTVTTRKADGGVPLAALAAEAELCADDGGAGGATQGLALAVRAHTDGGHLPPLTPRWGVTYPAGAVSRASAGVASRGGGDGDAGSSEAGGEGAPASPAVLAGRRSRGGELGDGELGRLLSRGASRRDPSPDHAPAGSGTLARLLPLRRWGSAPRGSGAPGSLGAASAPQAGDAARRAWSRRHAVHRAAPSAGGSDAGGSGSTRSLPLPGRAAARPATSHTAARRGGMRRHRSDLIGLTALLRRLLPTTRGSRRGGGVQRGAGHGDSDEGHAQGGEDMLLPTRRQLGFFLAPPPPSGVAGVPPSAAAPAAAAACTTTTSGVRRAASSPLLSLRLGGHSPSAVAPAPAPPQSLPSTGGGLLLALPALRAGGRGGQRRPASDVAGSSAGRASASLGGPAGAPAPPEAAAVHRECVAVEWLDTPDSCGEPARGGGLPSGDGGGGGGGLPHAVRTVLTSPAVTSDDRVALLWQLGGVGGGAAAPAAGAWAGHCGCGCCGGGAAAGGAAAGGVTAAAPAPPALVIAQPHGEGAAAARLRLAVRHPLTLVQALGAAVVVHHQLSARRCEGGLPPAAGRGAG